MNEHLDGIIKKVSRKVSALSNVFCFMDLRYHATFKVRKFESLFNKSNTCLPKTYTCIGLQAEQLFSVSI